MLAHILDLLELLAKGYFFVYKFFNFSYVVIARENSLLKTDFNII